MSYGLFKSVFKKILNEKPLPNGDEWKLQILGNAGLRNTNQAWLEVIYRTKA
jgi:hypothetical protein